MDVFTLDLHKSTQIILNVVQLIITTFDKLLSNFECLVIFKISPLSIKQKTA